jgi:hypothetical protein
MPYCTKCGDAPDLLISCIDFLQEPVHIHLATTKDHDHMHSVEAKDQHICVKCLWKEIAKVMLEVT